MLQLLVLLFNRLAFAAVIKQQTRRKSSVYVPLNNQKIHMRSAEVEVSQADALTNLKQIEICL